ncbi:MAG: hypothetical protein QNL80_08140 [Akkermansiaceae bacterium]|jgi:hypothetical protein|tara:strand:+ start:4348 stop:4569 length:222 start_codon:yes stop_codon:yes gene_type:complete
MRRPLAAALLIGQSVTGFLRAETDTVIPAPVMDVLAEYCIDCHDAASKKGDCENREGKPPERKWFPGSDAGLG